jgi:hypothetical protein
MEKIEKYLNYVITLLLIFVLFRTCGISSELKRQDKKINEVEKNIRKVDSLSIKKDDIKDITQSISDMGFDVKIGISWTKPGHVPFVDPNLEYGERNRNFSTSLTEKTGWNKTYTISMSKKSKSYSWKRRNCLAHAKMLILRSSMVITPSAAGFL